MPERAQSEVVVSQATEHYLIAPAQVSEIKTELRKHSPISKNQQTYHGQTQWQVDPQFRLMRRSHLCHIEQVVVNLRTTYTLPKLTDIASKNTAIYARFAPYYQALSRHERGHHEFGVQAAHAIEALLNQHEPNIDCRALLQTATKRIKAQITRYKALNHQYDLDTGYGRSQGAVIR